MRERRDRYARQRLRRPVTVRRRSVMEERHRRPAPAAVADRATLWRGRARLAVCVWGSRVGGGEEYKALRHRFCLLPTRETRSALAATDDTVGTPQGRRRR